MKMFSILLVFVVGFSFIGCKDNKDANCRLDVQKAIDKGDFNTAISKLQNECKTAYSQSDLNYNLATAYMGAAGYSVSDILKNAINAQNSSSSSFAAFLKQTSSNSKAYSLDYLQKAKTYYLKSLNKNGSSNLATVCSNRSLQNIPRVSNICLYGSVLLVSKFASSLSLLTKNIAGSISSIENSNGVQPDSMKASVDALAWAANQTLPNGSTITPTLVTISGTAYKHLKVFQNGKTFYRLADSSAPSLTSSTVLTEGYCDTNGNKSNCNGIENSDGSIDITNPNASNCYACPVLVNGSPATTSSVLVDNFNEAVNAVSAIAGNSNSSVKSSINSFKSNIDTNGDGSVSLTEIINYLNK